MQGKFGSGKETVGQRMVWLEVLRTWYWRQWRIYQRVEVSTPGHQKMRDSMRRARAVSRWNKAIERHAYKIAGFRIIEA